MSASSVDQLCESILENDPLFLRASINKDLTVGDDGAKRIAAVLKENSHITALELVECAIGMMAQ